MRQILLLLLPLAVATLAVPATAAPQPFGGEALNRLADGYELTLNATWTPDETEMMFSRGMKDWSRISIWTAPVGRSGIGQAKPVSFTDPSAKDVDPFIAPDGQAVYFASDRPSPGGGETRVYRLWKADRQGSGWSAPRPLTGEAESLGALLYPSVDRNGTLVFTRTTAEGPRLYIAQIKGDAVVNASPLNIPGVTMALDPTITLDGQRIVYVAPIEPGSRSRAIYMTRREGTGWSAPQIVYRPEVEGRRLFGTALSRDGRTLYFTSELSAGGFSLFSQALPN